MECDAGVYEGLRFVDALQLQTNPRFDLLVSPIIEKVTSR